MNFFVTERKFCDGKKKIIFSIPGMEILKKEKYPFNDISSPTMEQGNVGIHVLRRTI